MGKIKILGTGLSGLVGSRITELLKDDYEFENISLSEGTDITDKSSINRKFENSEAKIALHLAAKANVDDCEKDKEQDIEILGYKDIEEQEERWKEKKTAWGINVNGTKNVIEACKKTGKKMIYVSTDFVFDGENTPTEGYIEENQPNPINWYGKTKLEGEKLVKNSNLPWMITRIAYPYRTIFPKLDLVRALINLFKTNQKLKMIEDHILTPTFIDDIAYAFNALIKMNSTGIFHVVGSQFLTPYEIALTVSRSFNFDQSLIIKTTREEYFKERAKRPFDLSIKNDKIQKLGIRMKTFEEGLREVKQQIYNNLK